MWTESTSKRKWLTRLQDNKTLHGEYMLGRLYKAQKKIRPGVQKWNGGRLQMLCVQYQHYNYDVIAKNLL